MMFLYFVHLKAKIVIKFQVFALVIRTGEDSNTDSLFLFTPFENKTQPYLDFIIF